MTDPVGGMLQRVMHAPSTTDPQVDLAIVGGGAAGLATAVFAAEQLGPRRVLVLDGAPRLGAKILVAGGGRCNVTHAVVSERDYHGPRHLIKHVLAGFDVAAASAWFQSLGVTLKREPTGKLFPTTDDAHTVLNALLRRCGELGVTLATACRVRSVRRDDTGFLVSHAQGELHCRRLVLATGGKSLPRTGSDGQGYSLAQALGHTVTPTYPALAPLVLASDFFHAQLAGLSQPVTLRSFVSGKRVDERSGQMLWTHFGVSGPVVLDASRFCLGALAAGQPFALRMALVEDDFAGVEKWLIDAGQGRASLLNVLGQRLPQRLAQALCAHLKLPGATPGAAPGAGAQLPREARRGLAHALTELELPVLRDRGWNHAEVTAGGIPLSELDHRTMQSRCCAGLYLVGEILDVDGRIGGFNFQWAWSTAHRAALALVRDLTEA